MACKNGRTNLAAFALLISFALGFPSNREERSVPLTPQSDALTLLNTIDVSGWPDWLVVDHTETRNDVAFYDLSNAKVRFLDGNSLTMAADEILIPSGWSETRAQYDRHFNRIYVISTASQTGWYEASINIIEDRTPITTLSINEDFNEGIVDPPDDKYSVQGFVLEQPFAEGSNPARLIVDNTYTGKVDFVDLNALGTDVSRRQRGSYRAPLTDYSWPKFEGNSLALETNHETKATDDLTTRDILYISDPSHASVGGYGYIRVMRVGHPLQDLDATLLPEININVYWPFSNGLDGLDIAGPRDRLYIASASQSFDNGYMGRLNTTDNTFSVINLKYGDEGFLHVDWSDTNRVFIATYDGFGNDPDHGLYLHLIYDQTVVDTLKLMDNYVSGYDTGHRGLVYDPYSKRLYLSVGTKIMVIKVDYGFSPPNPDLPVRAYVPIMQK